MSVADFISLILSSKVHTTLYHFTDSENLPSIQKHGLLSKKMLRHLGMWPLKYTGGDQLSHQLDEFRGIDSYVSLCFTRNHPMKLRAESDGRLPNACFVAVKPDVLQIPGVRIAFGIANSNNVNIMPIEDALPELDVEVLYSRTDWHNELIQRRLQAAEKLEVLVPDLVPADYIIRL
jgi:hypothetical protein